jgi:hypothetical protein
MRRVKFTTAVKMDRPYIVADKGSELTLDDATADFAVHNKLGEYVGPPQEVGPTRAELEAQEAARLYKTATGQDWNDPGHEPDGQPVPEVAGVPEAPVEPKRPYGNAPKSAWADYAVKMSGIKGCPAITIERAEEMSKADLMSRYGARLGEED